MFYNVITLNPNQANDFIKKYMQDNIKVIDFSKSDVKMGKNDIF